MRATLLSALVGLALAVSTMAFVPGPAAQASEQASVEFADVYPSTQFSTEISWLAGRGISTGWIEVDGSRTYRPLLPVARDAMAAFLYRLAGQPAFTPPAQSPFSDVTPSTQFYREITWLADQGISTGWTEVDGSKTFRPLQAVNRDAMAAFLYRFAGRPWVTVPSSSPFIDVPAGSQFYREILWLARRGISTGWDEGYGCRSYRPLLPVARDAMAAFMYRYVNGGVGTISSGCNPPVTPGPSNPGNSKNCSDFATWQEAQDWFNTYYPDYGDVAQLDSDGDLIACELLPGHP